MRSKLGCLARLLKFVKARIEVSCAGVAPTLTADGGRVPWAGDSEFKEENVRSPKPLVSPSSGTSWLAASIGERVFAAATAGDCFAADKRALPLVARAPFDAFDAGVRTLDADTGASTSAGSAPVISKSPSLTAFGDFCAGAPRFARVDRVFVISPSLSSLKFCKAAVAFLVCFVVGFVTAGAACLRAAGFATRVVVVAFDTTFVRAGRGIVADEF